MGNTNRDNNNSGLSDTMHMYDASYLRKACNTLGSMLDYAVYSLHQNAGVFFDLFIASGIAASFEAGDVRLIAGMSGIELAYRVMDMCGLEYERVRPRFTTGVSKEYMCGHILAMCQWQTARPFNEIISIYPVSDIISMYDTLQAEARRELAEIWPPVLDADSPEKRAERSRKSAESVLRSIQEKMSLTVSETHLKKYRIRSGLSQSQLAALSNVPVRTIQQYEQRQKNINKAQFEYIIRLANVLSCDPGDLLEN
ncbi:MAG: helix-turn-helix transcriptional regulator [Mogibacterium sp.]|nr:helix-turn-helix transcriptional regulator [Mogibacterium sp.]MBR2541181.1 helix-turn-helix transcriptional regulator [Mogibacterium sp.]